MWRVLLVAFLIAHGGVHLAIWLSPAKPEAPFLASHSWLVGNQRGLAVGFAVVAASLLVAGGVGLWMGGSWWRFVGLTGLVASFLAMILFFHPWFIPIQVINAGLIFALLLQDWPTQAMVGA